MLPTNRRMRPGTVISTPPASGRARCISGRNEALCGGPAVSYKPTTVVDKRAMPAVAGMRLYWLLTLCTLDRPPQTERNNRVNCMVSVDTTVSDY